MEQQQREKLRQVSAAARALWGIDANDAHFIPTNAHTIVFPYTNEPLAVFLNPSPDGFQYIRVRIDLQHYIDPGSNIELWIGHAKVDERDIVVFDSSDSIDNVQDFGLEF